MLGISPYSLKTCSGHWPLVMFYYVLRFDFQFLRYRVFEMSGFGCTILLICHFYRNYVLRMSPFSGCCSALFFAASLLQTCSLSLYVFPFSESVFVFLLRLFCLFVV